jgi:hypothetical protein
MSADPGLGSRRRASRTFFSRISASDLRIAARFTLDRAQSVHAALRDAAQTIDSGGMAELVPAIRDCIFDQCEAAHS